jgi:hypothetical protein
MVVPGFVLGVVAGGEGPKAEHFFGIVGMFMVLFGGLLLHDLAHEEGSRGDRVVLLWCALQKLGASAAVGLGVAHGVFSSLALGVAGFDLLSGVIFLLYRRDAEAA